MNPVLLWSGVAVLVAGYIAFTLVLYVVRLRPLLRAAGPAASRGRPMRPPRPRPPATTGPEVRRPSPA